jgi:acetyl-CoA carboxylase carboxyl transferase subunit beta
MHKAENCPACHRQVSDDVLKKYQMVCPECGFHHRLDAAQRIDQIADAGSFKEFSAELCSKNPIELDGYAEKLRQNQKQSSMNEAVVTGTCTIEGQEAVLAVMSFDFMGGSMGSVVGEKITQAMFQGALSDSPVIIFTASGGARMQEGIFSLMQMAKTASAAALLEQTGVPLFIVLTHPTTRCFDRLCRSTGHRRNYRTETTRGVPEIRVPVEKGLCRCNRTARQAPYPTLVSDAHPCRSQA